MNNTEQITQLLTILLISLGILLTFLVFIYAIILMKTRSKTLGTEKKSNMPEKQATTSTKNKKETYNKNSVFDFMEFDKIEDNMIVQKNGMRYIMLMQCQGVNYDLLSNDEKNGVEEGFLAFLNTLRYPVQLYIQTRTVNLDKSLQDYRKNVEEIERELRKKELQYTNNMNSSTYSDEDLENQYYEIVKQTNLLEYGKDIINNTQKMSKNKNVLNNKYYIAIYYYPEEVSQDMDKSEIQDSAFTELYTRAQAIIRALYACSITTKILTSEEIAEVLYVAYNRDESEVFDFEEAMKGGYQELYSTAQDVWDKKINVLNEQIRNRAVEIANEAIEQVKTERQKEYELTSNNMERLANEVAALLIDDNDSYVGEDIAQDAIEKLNNKMSEWEEEINNEEQNNETKSKRGRPKKTNTII